MRILLDENIHPQVVALLRDAGHDVLSITETDKGASDPVVFQTAVSDERVLNQSQGGMCICRVLGIGAGVSRECFGP